MPPTATPFQGQRCLQLLHKETFQEASYTFSLHPGHPGGADLGPPSCDLDPAIPIPISSTVPMMTGHLGHAVTGSQPYASLPLQTGSGLALQGGFWKGWSRKDPDNYLFIYLFKMKHYNPDVGWKHFDTAAWERWLSGSGLPHTLPQIACPIPPSLQPCFHFIVNTISSPDAQTESKYQK